MNYTRARDYTSHRHLSYTANNVSSGSSGFLWFRKRFGKIPKDSQRFAKIRRHSRFTENPSDADKRRISIAELYSSNSQSNSQSDCEVDRCRNVLRTARGCKSAASASHAVTLSHTGAIQEPSKFDDDDTEDIYHLQIIWIRRWNADGEMRMPKENGEKVKKMQMKAKRIKERKRE